jgi:hypothetical protein
VSSINYQYNGFSWKDSTSHQTSGGLHQQTLRSPKDGLSSSPLGGNSSSKKHHHHHHSNSNSQYYTTPSNHEFSSSPANHQAATANALGALADYYAITYGTKSFAQSNNNNNSSSSNGNSGKMMVPAISSSASVSSSSATAVNENDPNFFRLKNLFIRMKTLQRKETTAYSSIKPNELYSYAIRWKNLVNELFQIPEMYLFKDVLELYHFVLKDYFYFYEMGLGEREEKWNEFVQQQEVRDGNL